MTWSTFKEEFLKTIEATDEEHVPNVSNPVGPPSVEDIVMEEIRNNSAPPASVDVNGYSSETSPSAVVDSVRSDFYHICVLVNLDEGVHEPSRPAQVRPPPTDLATTTTPEITPSESCLTSDTVPLNHEDILLGPYDVPGPPSDIDTVDTVAETPAVCPTSVSDLYLHMTDVESSIFETIEDAVHDPAHMLCYSILVNIDPCYQMLTPRHHCTSLRPPDVVSRELICCIVILMTSIVKWQDKKICEAGQVYTRTRMINEHKQTLYK